MDKWNDICCVIEKYAGSNLKEDTFQNVVENIFGLLGWSHSKNEIDSKRIIQYGSSGKIIPDIILKSEGKDRFVVELKKQSIPHKESHLKQLFSYMRALKVPFGLIIGSKIQLYYDNDDPIKLIEIAFSKDNLEGCRLFELLKRDSFSNEKLIDYCKERLAIIEQEKMIEQEMATLTSSIGEGYVVGLIADDYKRKGFENNAINALMENISISIKRAINIKSEVNENQNIISNHGKPFAGKGMSLNQEDKESREVDKIERRIPIWLSKSKSSSVNSQMFIIFMKLLGEKDFVDRNEFISNCHFIDKLNIIDDLGGKLFSEKLFKGHLSSLSQFGEKNDGKVFDIFRNEMRLWSPIELFAKEQYRNNFNE